VSENHSSFAGHGGDRSASLDELLEIDPRNITTVIDQGVHFEGTFSSQSGKAILVSGKVTGSIESTGAVIVNVGGEVHGTIKAKAAQIAGTVRRRTAEDKIDVEGTLVLAKGAKVICDAVYGDLKAEHGVVISGNMQPSRMPADGVEDADMARGTEAATGTHGGASVLSLHRADQHG
jgi:cytoskeletal protein CcmA (bactofilin family)